MNWGNLLWIVYYAAHTAAGIFNLILEMELYHIGKAGLWTWVVSGVCLVLLAMDLAGRISLRGSGAEILAALVLPFLCGRVELLLLDHYISDRASPAVWVWAFSQLLLAGYMLLRERETDVLLDRAEALLAQGGSLGAVMALWLLLIGGAVIFMSTFGLVVSLFVGSLISSKNSLLDYGGMKGLLLGIGVLYVLQCLRYWRGARLAREALPELDCDVSMPALFVPVWNKVQARKLARQLQLQGVKAWY